MGVELTRAAAAVRTIRRVFAGSASLVVWSAAVVVVLGSLALTFHPSRALAERASGVVAGSIGRVERGEPPSLRRTAPAPAPAPLGAFTSPHGGFTLTTSTCATCHRTHTAAGSNLLTKATPQSALCFSCHDGTGAQSNVQSVYTDPSVPANNPATSSFYSHLPSATSVHVGGQEDEFAGVLNRHAECGD